MTTYSIQTQVEASFTFPGLAAGEREVAYPVIEIEFGYIPGRPATGPTYSSGGEPPEPAEIEFRSVKLINGDGLILSDQQLQELASDWIDSDVGYLEACEAAEAQSGPDPDMLYDAMRDEPIDGWPGEDQDEGDFESERMA